MTSQLIRFPTLATVLWPALSDDRSETKQWTKQWAKQWARYIILATIGAALLTLSAKIKIPFYPVPMTMQTFVVLALGIAYGSKLGAATVLLYLAAGVIGLPVFAGTPEKGIGLVYMMGPTGGYLLGFVVAAAATGYLAEQGWDRKPALTFAAMLIGNLMIYIPGLIWLADVVGWDKPIFEWGMNPFLLGDLAKIALAMLVIPAIWTIIKKPGIKKPG
ncbi:biotin transporter BioY [Candidatus Spongiihabitans sp.]|uniref:biotin transporter BioY n=1 Tax=Candidatus Spongiihabitans sp. TaxID=3101308 RepID=UPI003C7DF85F